VTGVNIWNVPVDIYTQSNVDPYNGGPLIANCPTTTTIRACIQSYLQTWQSQGVTGVRFFIGVAAPLQMAASYFKEPDGFVASYTPGSPLARDGGYSHPWIWNGSQAVIDVANWQQNLLYFFRDLATYGMAASPSLGLDPGNAYLTSDQLDCTGANQLKFLPWLPYGFLPNGFEDCQGINDAYKTWANGNPYFWGWGPFSNLVSAVVGSARSAGISLREFETMQERHADPPLQGDSAMLLDASALTGAIGGSASGGNGVFGKPSGYTSQNLLWCGGSTTGMEQLPVWYYQPEVLDVHAYPCIMDPSNTFCTGTDATSTAEIFYSDVYSFLGAHSMLGAMATFGESSVIDYCSITGQANPSWAINGYLQSTLRNVNPFAGNVVFQPFNNIQNSCYTNPINITDSPYNPFN